MLFSEPKISQFRAAAAIANAGASFSALQRAENFSIITNNVTRTQKPPFQCSSASRKFLNSSSATISITVYLRFSALQRAENFSIGRCCRATRRLRSFSALQRAENFSIRIPNCAQRAARRFQCSSASRKFLNQASSHWAQVVADVSVLFSEPKISQ